MIGMDTAILGIATVLGGYIGYLLRHIDQQLRAFDAEDLVAKVQANETRSTWNRAALDPDANLPPQDDAPMQDVAVVADSEIDPEL